MKTKLGFSGRFAPWFVFLILGAAGSANACTVCMGDPGSREAGAMNAAIFLMLAFIGGVLGLAVAFGVYLHRKSVAPLEPHVAFVSGGSFNQNIQED
jgi:hypothetical protein